MEIRVKKYLPGWKFMIVEKSTEKAVLKSSYFKTRHEAYHEAQRVVRKILWEGCN